MRILILMAGTILVAGCASFAPSRTTHGCDSASHDLRVHDMKIDAARSSGSMGFSATLASRGYTSYQCMLVPGNQVACVAAGAGAGLPRDAQVRRLLRERDAIEERVARACHI